MEIHNASFDDTKDFGVFCPCRSQKKIATCLQKTSMFLWMPSAQVDIYFFLPAISFLQNLQWLIYCRFITALVFWAIMSWVGRSGPQVLPAAELTHGCGSFLSLDFLCSSWSLRSFSNHMIKQPWPPQMRAICTLSPSWSFLCPLLWGVGRTAWEYESYCSPVTCD